MTPCPPVKKKVALSRFSSPRRRASVAVAFGLFVAFTACLPAWAQVEGLACGSLQNGYGPYDYRTDKPKLPIVEGAHFTAAVEALIRGSTSSLGPGGDLDYTLRAFPNHHRALVSVMNYGEKVKPRPPKDLPRSVECYFERALRFRPDDTVARMIYATYLAKNKREADANKQLDQVAAAANDNAFTYYNLGLIYFDIKNYDKALEHAHKAYGLGFEAVNLRDQLKKVGKWIEPAPKPDTPQPGPAVVDEKR
jgi:hypothetical protein